MTHHTNPLQMCLLVGCLSLLPSLGMQAQYNGRRTDARQVLSAQLARNGNTCDTLWESKRLPEVVVSGTYSPVPRNIVGNALSSQAIERSLGTSLAALLEQVSGVSSVSTGTTVAKPVIQGMYGNRILIINNGARQTGQQWGADHAPELDISGSNSIQVIKGSDAVRYGSDALGGIIVVEQAPLPFRKRTLDGNVSILYGSNGQRYLATGQLEGTFSFLPDLAWRVQGTYANAGDRSTAHYFLNNTGTREYNATASLGYDHGPFRAEGFYSRFYNKIGVLFSAQMGSEDLLEERILLGRPQYVTPFTRTIAYPYQAVTHQTAIGKVRYALKAGILSWQGAWQKDDRQENRIRRSGSDIPAVSLHLRSVQNSLSWKLARPTWQTEVGGQVLYTDNRNQAGTGIVPVIPNYTERQAGAYATAKYDFGRRGGVEAGIRFDGQETRADGYDWTGSRYGGKRTFRNLSYSAGGHYLVGGHWKFTSHFGVAWRAPHVYELYSNGNELGSGMFVKGDSTLHSERSYKWISSVNYRNRLLDVRVDGFLQWIDGYLYDEPTHTTVTVLSGAYPIFAYRQTPAFFRGVDLDLHVTPSAAWDYRLTASFLRANERGTGNYLPYIPPFRLAQEAAWTHEFRSRSQLALRLRHRFVAKQTRFDPSTDLIPYTPPAYHLLDCEASWEWHAQGGYRICFRVAADNLLNKEYKEYTNRARYYAHDMGRDVRCSVSLSF